MSRANATIEKLNSFLRGEISAVETYRQAIERIHERVIAEELVFCLRSHEERVKTLRERIAALGGTPVESSGVWGTVAKIVEAGASALGESAAVAALEEGEDRGMSRYGGDLSGLDEQSRDLVKQQLLPKQVKTHRTMSSLKMAMHP